MTLTHEEEVFYLKYKEMKMAAGSHAPSIYQLIKECPQIKINIDACFLCNPYAFDLFMQHFSKTDVEKYIKFYPPQNHEIARNISVFNNIPCERILVGNGAIEIIQSLFSNFVDKKIMITMPSFSAYYEIAEGKNTIIPYFLEKTNDFNVDTEDYISFIIENKPDVVVIINPNNPTGTLIKKEDLVKIHKALSIDQLLVIDESFIHFSSDDETLEKYSIAYQNIIVIRSLSKDFGIAGIRLGYAIMPEQIIQNLCKTGFLWNSNGLAYHFTELMIDADFINSYNLARSLYISSRDDFFIKLKKQKDILVYPSSANFFLIETIQDPAKVFIKLLFQYGIYTRILNDKIGLEGSFVRIASKNQTENNKIVNALKELLQ